MTEKVSKTYIFNNPVYDEHISKVVAWLQDVEKEGLSHVNLVVNSPGGAVEQAFHLIDMMQTSSAHICTIASGQVASCGLLIAMSGDYRQIYKNTMVLSHQYSWGVAGKHHELVAGRVAQDQTNDMLLDHYKIHTGLPINKIKKELLNDSDTWLTAHQAIKLGLFDAIVYNNHKDIGVEDKKKRIKQDKAEDIKRAKRLLGLDVEKK